ncbi:MAG TPA: alpha/beta hydrolase [Allosphingosinicella sp.]|nr:alpha/beta hydrolase [Allosphingosinicella sp.]
MSSQHLVDPELAPFLDLFPSVLLSHDNLEEVRNRVLPLPPIEESGVDLERIAVPGPAGAPEIMLHVYRPREAARPMPCIYHMHGGGYVLGAARDMEPVHRPLAAKLGCAIVSVDYRLAPEAPFPGPLEDCYAGLAWTFANAEALGVDPGRIGVMGESAGGGLAAALALLARDRGEYRLAFQQLIYPMLDDRTCTSEPHPFAGEFLWHPHNNRFGWSSLLGQAPGGEGVSPYAAAARATDLAGLPPAFIGTGALDLFLEEDVDYARRLVRAGVPTELHVYPGAFHAFDMMAGAAVAEQARRDSHAALARFLAA